MKSLSEKHEEDLQGGGFTVGNTPSLKNWNDIKSLIQKNPEALRGLIDSLDNATWSRTCDYLAIYNPIYLKKYQDKIQDKDWKYVISFLAQFNPIFIKDFQHKVENWESTFKEMFTTIFNEEENGANVEKEWKVYYELFNKYS